MPKRKAVNKEEKSEINLENVLVNKIVEQAKLLATGKTRNTHHLEVAARELIKLNG